MAKTILDARGLICPLPVLRAIRALKSQVTGDILEIVATDANAGADLAAFCKSSGHVLLNSRQDKGVFTIVLRKSG